jgi:hypothetical protein
MRCVGVAEIRFIKYFRDEGMGKSVKNMVVEESRGGGGAARMPARVPRRRSGGGGVTCNLHVAAHAACQASQCDSRSLPLPCHHALWQRCSLRRPAKPRPRQTCKRRRRAHYLSRGGWRFRGKIATRQHDHLLGPQSCVIVLTSIVSQLAVRLACFISQCPIAACQLPRLPRPPPWATCSPCSFMTTRRRWSALSGLSETRKQNQNQNDGD